MNKENIVFIEDDNRGGYLCLSGLNFNIHGCNWGDILHDRYSISQQAHLGLYHISNVKL